MKTEYTDTGNASLATMEQFNKPDDLTHSVAITIVSRDGQRRTVTVRYCQSDRWLDGSGYLDNARTILSYILPVIAKDRNVATLTLEIKDLKTLEVVHQFSPLLESSNKGITILN